MEAKEIRLLDGTTLAIPEGMTASECLTYHIIDKLSEHICPYHGVKLTVELEDSKITPGTGIPYYSHFGCSWVWQVEITPEYRCYVQQELLAFAGIYRYREW